MTVLATVLQELAWDRGDREYNLRYEDYLYRLGLPWECDRDRSDEIDPHHRDVLVWLETELWNDYVDWVEEETGFESEHVMDLRGQDCVSEADCQVWRQWATQVSSMGPQEPDVRDQGVRDARVMPPRSWKEAEGLSPRPSPNGARQMGRGDADGRENTERGAHGHLGHRALTDLFCRGADTGVPRRSDIS